MAPSISVFVQCPQTLRPGFERCRASIEESDIGKNYEVVMHPPGMPLADHFIGLLRKMGEAKTDLALRFEDDVDVNRFILHNLTHWPAIHDSRFLLGWAFDPNGTCCYRSILDYIYGRHPCVDRWVPQHNDVYYSQAILMWTRDANDIANACEVFWKKVRPDLGGGSMDVALTYAPRILKRGQVVVHGPSLVEHMLALPSQLGNNHARNGTSAGTFSKDWKQLVP